jgi:hypothetical protein
MQTVHQTASGIDPETGYTVDEVMAGRIDDPQIVQLINRQLANQSQTNENLPPVFDDTGKVVAFERAADPEKLAKLNRSTDLSQMIGVWRGRQMEEMLAQDGSWSTICTTSGSGTAKPASRVNSSTSPSWIHGRMTVS